MLLYSLTVPLHPCRDVTEWRLHLVAKVVLQEYCEQYVVQAIQDKTGQIRAGSNMTGQRRTGQGRGRAGQGRAGQGKHDRA